MSDKLWFAFAALLIAACISPAFAQPEDTYLLENSQRLERSTYNLEVSERVARVPLTGCTSSANASLPVKILGPISCPCFLSYRVRPDATSLWDVLLLEKSSFFSWKNSSFDGDPPNYRREYSSINITSDADGVGFGRNDTNVYLEGEYFLVFRAKAQTKVCFDNDLSDFDGYSNKAVFESMPPACPILVKNDVDVARIVGGVPVPDHHCAPKDFSWIASITLQDGSLLCGGSQIAPGFILTAAHCNVTADLSSYHVRVGTLLGNSGPAQRVKRIWVHPEFRLLSIGAENDLAIFELESPAVSADHSTIPLNDNADHPVPGEYVTVAGYGYTSEDWSALPNPDYLRRVDMSIWDSNDCRRVFNTHNSEIQICASIKTGGCDSCRYVIIGSEYFITIPLPIDFVLGNVFGLDT